MNGFRGNRRSSDTGKKGRKVRLYHHDECKCSAPLLKLHYDDCPALTKTCPLHGKVLHHSLKEVKAQREENAGASNNPCSKTERLFRPVKSLLTVCDPEAKFNMRNCSPKNSSSQENIKRPSETENAKTNFNKLLVEKAKPFVAGQTNKIKKLKQCFHSPCSSILQKSRSQALVKEKAEPTKREFCNSVLESPPDEKKYESGFKWFPPGKLHFKNVDKKNGSFAVHQEKNSDGGNKFFGGQKPKKWTKDLDSPFESKIPVFGFPREATQFVYSSFAFESPKRASNEGKANEGSKWKSKEDKEHRANEKEQKVTKLDKNPSDFQTTTTASSDESVYISPYVFKAPELFSSEEELSRKAPTISTTTQTINGHCRCKSIHIQTDPEPKKERKDFGVQVTSDPVSTHSTKSTKNAASQTETSERVTSSEPAKPIDSEVTFSNLSEVGSSAPDGNPQDISVRNLSYVIESIEPLRSDVSFSDGKVGSRMSRSDSELYTRRKSRNALPTVLGKDSEMLPCNTPKPQKSSHQRANQPPRKTLLSQQVSLQEELYNAVSDLTELKNIIYQYCKRHLPLSDGCANKVDHETMTDSLTLKTAKKAFNNAESQTAQDIKTGSAAGQNFHCIEIEDLDQAAVFCVCNLCGREVKRFTINVSSTTQSNKPILEPCQPNRLDLYREMIEMKTMRTTGKNSEMGVMQDPGSHSQMSAAKATRRTTLDSIRVEAYESWNPCSSSSSAAVKPSSQKQSPKSSPKSSTKPEAAKTSQNNKKANQGKGSRARKPAAVPSPRKDAKDAKDAKDTKGKKGNTKPEYYYPVIIKPILSRQFTKMLEKKFNENASEESSGPTSKQKRTYDKYFEQTNAPAGKKIKQGFEDFSGECLSKNKSTISDLLRENSDGETVKKGFGLILPSSNEYFCEKPHKDRNAKDLAQVKSLSLDSLNNLLSAKSRHLRPIPIGCDEESFRDLFEFSNCQPVRFLKTNDGGILFHPWTNGTVDDDADDGSISSDDDKNAPPSSGGNFINDDDAVECTCRLSERVESREGIALRDMVEDAQESRWKAHSRRPKSCGRRACSSSACPKESFNSSGTFWFGQDYKGK